MEINQDIHIKTEFLPQSYRDYTRPFKMGSMAFFIFIYVLRKIWSQMMKCNQIYYSL